jgi:hypothetical protein
MFSFKMSSNSITLHPLHFLHCDTSMHIIALKEYSKITVSRNIHNTGLIQKATGTKQCCYLGEGHKRRSRKGDAALSTKNTYLPLQYADRDSSVGIRDSLRAGESGYRNQVEVRFSAPVQTGLGAHPASYTMGTGSFQGVKRPGRGVDHAHLLVPRLKKGYTYNSTPPSGPSWPIVR